MIYFQPYQDEPLDLEHELGQDEIDDEEIRAILRQIARDDLGPAY